MTRFPERPDFGDLRRCAIKSNTGACGIWLSPPPESTRPGCPVNVDGLYAPAGANAVMVHGVGDGDGDGAAVCACEGAARTADAHAIIVT